jgi:futalosine hydrolase
MRILLVSATAMEIVPIVRSATLSGEHSGSLEEAKGRVKHYTYAGHDVDALVTGVGMVATAVWTSRVLTEARYDLALNVGVCGSFDRAFAPGAVVHVVTDRLAELGAEDGDAFIAIEDLHLPVEHEFVNAMPPVNAALSRLPAVTGITVNLVHGSARSIAAVVERFAPQVESMEGAAFMSACIIHELPFAQVRAVSNAVERRNRDAWRMAEAIACLGETALSILGDA